MRVAHRDIETAGPRELGFMPVETEPRPQPLRDISQAVLAEASVVRQDYGRAYPLANARSGQLQDNVTDTALRNDPRAFPGHVNNTQWSSPLA